MFFLLYMYVAYIMYICIRYIAGLVLTCSFVVMNHEEIKEIIATYLKVELGVKQVKNGNQIYEFHFGGN